jgi:hypothetical protein
MVDQAVRIEQLLTLSYAQLALYELATFALFVAYGTLTYLSIRTSLRNKCYFRAVVVGIISAFVVGIQVYTVLQIRNVIEGVPEAIVVEVKAVTV